jgi:hypothetical protein
MGSRPEHLAMGRRRQTAQNAQQAGFATTIAPFDVQPTARCHGKADAFEQGSVGLLAGQVHRFHYPRRHCRAFRSVEDKTKCNDRLTLCAFKASDIAGKSG